ncbi:hypothetical protein ACFFKU_07140 [Kineococcus gynurae]|uniref:DUF2530 domain-containing protein n=1 Tax=Kineococcus gynurae TaxID=452979 RepID=A0ABV5LWS0_9ACTN
MTAAQLKRAWRTARRGAQTELRPVDLTTDRHTPTRGTRVWAIATFVCLAVGVVAMGGRGGDPIAPDWVMGAAGGVGLFCAVVWILLYRRARAAGRPGEQR